MNAQGALDSLLGRLTTILLEEAQLLGRVRVDVEFIKDEMESMNSLLMQLTEAQHRNHQVRTWMKHVVRLTRDCEGNVELYIHYVGGGGGGGPLGYLRRVVRFVRTIRVRHRIATRIRELKDHARDVGERRQRYGVTVPAASDLNAAGAAEAPEDNHRWPVAMRYRYEPPEMYDGNDKLVDTLVRWLTEGQSPAATATSHDEDDREPPLRVLNVIGRDPDYSRYHLINRACRHQSVRAVFDYQIKLDEYNYGMDFRSEYMRRELKGNRFLISVYEDEEDYKLEKLKRITDGLLFAAVGCVPGSTIILLTSDFDRCPLRPRKTMDLRSASQIYTREVKSIQKRYRILRYPPDKALQMCDHIGSGDAFAMKMFVCLVHVKPHRTEEELDMYWKAISECKWLKKSVGQQMVMFCYNELPIKYRSCLLYLTVLPKDHRIRATSLVRRWIAEGLIATSTAAGDGEKCFLDVFFTRGFVSYVEFSAAGDIKSFTLHQEVRESIARVARDVNFVEENLPPDLAHHLSIHNRIVLRGSRTDSDSKGIVALLPTLAETSQWQLLKVLDLEGCKGLKKNHLKRICKILLLKYLSLRSTDVTQLPRQIKHLQCLETLDIRETGVQALSKKAIVLPRLKHFLAGHKVVVTAAGAADNNSCEEESSCTTVRTPLGIERMKDMEILSHVLVSYSDTELAGIAQLLKLRKLGVLLRGEDANKLLPDLLRQIKNLCSCLRSLSIRIIDQPAGGGGGGDNHDQQAVVVVDAAALTPAPEFIERLNITGLTHGLPQFIQQLNGLTKLTLTETYLAKQGLFILAKLNCLRSLMLQQNSYTESELAFKEGEFRNLNSLLVGSSNITTIRFERGGGFWLRRIVWSFPTTAPCLFGVSHLIYLQEFELNGDCSPDQVRDALEMERHRVQRPCFRHNPQGPATCTPSSAP